MGLEQIVNVNISRETGGVTQEGFGTGLIIGNSTSALTKGAIRTYTSAVSVLDDFASSDPEYKAAVKYFGQTPKPSQVKIARVLDFVTQIKTVTPNVSSQTIQHFIVTINGVDFDFTSDITPTAAEVVTGLAALINAGTEPVTASGTNTLILTADTQGVPFTLEVSTNLGTPADTADNLGYPDELARLAQVDNDWYGVIATTHTLAQVMAIAEYVESVRKLYGTSSNAAGMLDIDDATDLASLLKAKGYFRTFVIYSADAANYPEAAIFGRVLPLVPGSETWAFKTMAGIAVDALTDSNIAALQAKYANYYVSIGGRNIFLDGKVSGNEWIDVIRLIDWMQARMQETIFGDLVRLDKIPFTDAGISIIELDVQSVLKTAQDNGGIARDTVDENDEVVKGWVTNFPLASEVSANDKAARNLVVNDAFTARLAGAIQTTEINGSVTF